MKLAVVLLSGGLDSSTVVAVARADGHDVVALTIDYGQRHRVEIESSRRVAEAFGVVRHVVFPVDLSLFGGSSLTGDMEVAKDVPLDKIGSSIPNTYVPARNIIFLSIAASIAESINAEKIYIGVSAIDYSGYPDCRPEFLNDFQTVLNHATKSGTEGKAIEIVAPLLYLNKSETIKLGLSLGVDYSKTHTCYSPTSTGLACGRCESCLLRLQAFNSLGIKDPIKYDNQEI
jgi:7-cyano-7-deazaguanine synthase